MHKLGTEVKNSILLKHMVLGMKILDPTIQAGATM